MSDRLPYYEINTKAVNMLMGTKKHLGSIDSKLQALIELRVSQINGCVYCVDLHTREARAHGETRPRLDCLPACSECDFFTDGEKSALAWAEAVTLLPETGAPDELYDDLKEFYSDQQIVDLTIIISLMNSLNRLAAGFRDKPDSTG